MHFRLRTLSGLATCTLLVTANSPLLAAETPIVVTATRLLTQPLKARGNTTVITSGEIEASTAKTLPELLGREAGILTRSLFGTGSSASTVDIRGFGATGTQNTLILIDGRRLNDIDLSSVDFSEIPLKSIERIEITRNGGAVLYGDGAVGGTINIITRQPDSTPSSTYIRAGAGNLDTQLVDLHLNRNAGPWSFSLGAHGTRSAGYRDNNKLEETSIKSGIRYTADDYQLSLNVSGFDQESGLPGERRVNPGAGINQLLTDRRGTDNPADFGDQQGFTLHPGLTVYLQNGSEAVIDMGYRNKQQQAFFGDYSSGGMFADYIDSEIDTWSLTPRINIPHSAPGVTASTTIGVDLYASRYHSDRSLNPGTAGTPIHRLDIDQDSLGIYADTLVETGSNITVNLGARAQWMELDAKDSFDGTAPGAVDKGESGALPYSDKYDVQMLEAGIEKQFVPETAGYVKWTRNTRLTTVDELFELDAGFMRVFSPLEPQTGNGIDAGIRYGAHGIALGANAYYMRLRNEIHFDPSSFQNVNLDPTERYGIELDGKLQASDRLRLSGNYTYLRSRFRDGAFAGNDVPLVPEHKATLSATWKATATADVTVTASYVGERYFDNDQANSFGQKIPSHTMLDAKLSGSAGDYRLALIVNNIAGEKAVDYAVSSTFTPGVYNAYPLPERTVLLTVSRTF